MAGQAEALRGDGDGIVDLVFDQVSAAGMRWRVFISRAGRADEVWWDR
jgi:hypothetical protein